MSANSFGQLGLSIIGLGTQYPPYGLKPDAIDTLVHRYHNADAPAMKKILSINKYTGIEVCTLNNISLLCKVTIVLSLIGYIE